jgi:predicted DNA-binding transcriptional regulator YafY
VKVTPEMRAELLSALRLRRTLTNKALCARFGVSPRTLVRLQHEELDAAVGDAGPKWRTKRHFRAA